MTTSIEYQGLQVSKNYILKNTPADYKVGIVLGTGLSAFREELSEVQVVPFKEVFEGVKGTGAPNHKGELVLGKINGTKVVLMDGRLHYYEGYDMSQVARPIRLLKLLGVETLIITSAVGGLDTFGDSGRYTKQKEGDIVALEDHINLMGDSPLRGPEVLVIVEGQEHMIAEQLCSSSRCESPELILPVVVDSSA